jgi:hypothetical protein
MGDSGNNAALDGAEKEPTRSKGIVAWVAQWGFAILVALGVLASAYLAWKAPVPAPVPDFALKAPAIYRIEIGAGAFLGLYLVTMAFVLALNNRGFSEIGVNGLKAQDMANKAQQDAIQSHEDSLEILSGMVDDIEASTGKSVQNLQARLEALEAAKGKSSSQVET